LPEVSQRLCNTKNIVVGAFNSIPEDFQLRGYHAIPDSSEFTNPLYDMKAGKGCSFANKTFELTERGLEVRGSKWFARQRTTTKTVSPSRRKVKSTESSTVRRSDCSKNVERKPSSDTDF